MIQLISVIVPIYNVDEYLSKCLDSILGQSYTNTEIILVDDGSTDKCPAICDEYASKDPRITVIHKENGGLSDARNAGLDIAKGDYITFIDSDDWIEEKYLETLIRLAIQKKSDVAIVENDGAINLTGAIYEFSPKESLQKCLDNTTIMFTVAWGKLYKNTLWSIQRFPKGKLHEDIYTIHKILYQANKIVYLASALYHYTIRENSISQKKINLDLLDALEQRFVFFQEKQIETDFLMKAEYEIIWSYLFTFAKLQSANKVKSTECLKKARKHFNHIKKESSSSIIKLCLTLFLTFPALYKLNLRINPLARKRL